MKYSKDFSKGIGFGHVGAKAYEVSKVWELGPRFFRPSDGGWTFRINFLRTKNRTYYFQVFCGHRRAATDSCCP